MSDKPVPIVYADKYNMLHDSLDGKTPLKGGVYWITFADNIPRQHLVEVEKVDVQVEEGIYYDDLQAFIVIEYCGSKIKVYLREVVGVCLLAVSYASGKCNCQI